jgi:hypothetical protein
MMEPNVEHHEEFERGSRRLHGGRIREKSRIYDGPSLKDVHDSISRAIVQTLCPVGPLGIWFAGLPSHRWFSSIYAI